MNGRILRLKKTNYLSCEPQICKTIIQSIMAQKSDTHTADEITVALQDPYYPNQDNDFGLSFCDDQITAQWFQGDNFPDFFAAQNFPGVEWANQIPLDPVLQHSCSTPPPKEETHRGIVGEKRVRLWIIDRSPPTNSIGLAERQKY
jgi:hypothetical protein